MATAMYELVEEQFLCSICLDVFTEPVTTPCGHNFCKKCLDQHWNESRSYKCPYCKQDFHPRPELKVNIFISEIAQQFRSRVRTASLQKTAAPGEVSCDLCSEPRLKALKSCLVCLSSYCDQHLQPHLSVPGLKGHALSQPLNDLCERVCEEHNKPLELFCLRDQCCLCVHCTYWKHKQHDVRPLKYGCEQQLQNKTDLIRRMIRTKEAKIEQLRRSIEANNKEADRQATNGEKIFTVLKTLVETSLKQLIQEINKSRTAAEQQAMGYIAEIEQEISELKTRCRNLEQLPKSEDHFNTLKSISQLTPAPEVWTMVNVHQPMYNHIVVRTLSDLEQYISKNTKQMFEEDLKRVRSYIKPIMLDSTTAHPQLTVSVKCTEVQCTSQRSVTEDGPNRFDKGLFVLGTQSFSEMFYFEAMVSGTSEWILGVAQESITRKGNITLNPKNGFWTIGFSNKTFYASADTEVHLLIKCRPEKLGVFVNYPERIVSFYHVEEHYLIFSFTDCVFGGNLYPFFSPGKNNSENSANLVLWRPVIPSSKKTIKRYCWLK